MKESKSLKLALSIIFVIFVGIFVFYGGFQLGSTLESRADFEYKYPEDFEKPEILDVDFSLFWDAIKKIKEKYVWIDDVEDQDLFYGSIKGLIDSLGDPNSSFFSPEDSKRFEEDLSGKFGGIGAEIGIRDNQLMIIAPLKGTPADEMGLKAGDKIMGIDGESTLGITIEEAVRDIRGEPGDLVVLLILRDEWSEPRDIEIIRDVITIPTLDWEMIDRKKVGNRRVAYIQLYNFGGNATSMFAGAVSNILLEGVDGLILDLRNNSGGYLDASVNIAGWFLKRGEIVVKEEFKLEKNRVFRASGNASLKNIPTVVIVNRGSASASEILAGALRDQNEAILVGEQTFGKGTVQEVLNMKDGSMIKISISEWITPSGKRIEKEGLTPDYEVELPEDLDEEMDYYFEKAVEVLISNL